jgi:hypothetical protein
VLVTVAVMLTVAELLWGPDGLTGDWHEVAD